jgi:hypothetical protein
VSPHVPTGQTHSRCQRALASPRAPWHRACHPIGKGFDVTTRPAAPDPPPGVGRLWRHHVPHAIGLATPQGRDPVSPHVLWLQTHLPVWEGSATATLFNGFPYFAVYLLRFHQRCQSRSPRAPSCAIWFSGESTPLPIHCQPGRSQESPLNPHHRLVHQIRFYHILYQAVPI